MHGFLVLILQFVTCIFHGCEVNGFPKHQCQNTVIVLKKHPPHTEIPNSKEKTKQTTPSKTNKNNKKPKPTKKKV